jgi:hypothetical protein
MDDIIEYCFYQSGLTAQGCWDELDDYAKEAILRFGELLLREIALQELADQAQELGLE